MRQFLQLVRQFVLPWLRGIAKGRPVAASQYLLRNLSALVRDRLLPSEVRLFRFERSEIRAIRSKLYLQADHHRHLDPFRAAITGIGLHDKARFAQFCRDSALPHPATERLTKREVVDARSLLERMGANRLVIKPAIGSGARGLVLLHRSQADGWTKHSREGGAQTGDLQAILAALNRAHDIVIQPELQNHPDLREMVGSSLATFRIITGRGAENTVTALSILAELPLDDTRPIPQTWAILPVDQEQGRIALPDRARLDRLQPEQAERAQRYGGQRIEQMADMTSLAQAAHRAVLAGHSAALPPMIGWDIALTSTGPMVLELNWNWGIAPHYANLAGTDFSLSQRFRSFAGDQA